MMRRRSGKTEKCPLILDGTAGEALPNGAGIREIGPVRTLIHTKPKKNRMANVLARSCFPKEIEIIPRKNKRNNLFSLFE
jgi:hypothetical protein